MCFRFILIDMDVQSRSPYQSEISIKNGVVHVVGSLALLNQIQNLKNKFGSDPIKWPELEKISTGDDLLLNEFILKCHGKFKLAYPHTELCHCRMVPAEKVYNAIKQGVTTIEDVCRTTLAGTGCGTCRPDSQNLLDQFKKSN